MERNNSASYLTNGDAQLVHLILDDESVQQLVGETVRDNSREALIFVVDKSGSMAGSKMNTAVEMTRISLEAARHARYGFVHVIMFNNKSTAYPVTTLAQEQSLLNNDMRAGGGTSFKACLTDLANVLVGVKNTNATVIFLTDGQNGDSNSQEIYTHMLPALRELLNRNELTLNAIIVGVGSDADARFLATLVQAANGESCIHYCRESRELAATSETVVALINGGKSTVRLQCHLDLSAEVGVAAQAVSLELPLDMHRNSAGAWESVVEVDAKPAFLRLVLPAVRVNDAAVSAAAAATHLTVPVETLALHDPARLRVLQRSLSERLVTLTNALVASAQDKDCSAKADVIFEALVLVRAEVATLLDEAGRIKLPSLRSELKTSIYGMTDQVSLLLAKLAEIKKGGISNAASLELLDLAHQRNQGVKKQLARKLDERLIANAAKYEEDENKLNAYLLKFDEAKALDEFPEAAEFVCSICQDNVIQCSSMGKLLGYTARCASPEAAIADPFQWVLHEVYGALICSECIVTMMIRALKNNSDGLGAAGRADPAAHGSKLMVLIQGQPFNAMIPVVLHKSQADILFLTDKRVLGCQVAGDPFGFSASQRVAVYGKALWWTIHQLGLSPSEFASSQHAALLRTFQQIWRVYSRNEENNLQAEFLAKFGAYTAAPENRTLDVVPDSHVFVAQLLTARSYDLLADVDLRSFFMLLAEEQTRRTLSHSPDVAVACVEDLLVIDLDLWCLSHVRAYEASLSQVAASGNDVFLTKLFEDHPHLRPVDVVDVGVRVDEQKADSASAQVLPCADPTAYDGSLLSLSPSATAICEKAETAFQRVCHHLLGPAQAALRIALPTTLVDFGIDTNEKRLVFAHQLATQTANSDRRAAKAWFLPTDQAAAKEYIRALFVDVVTKRKASAKNAVDAALLAHRSGAAAATFSQTPDLLTAIATMLYSQRVYTGTNIGVFFDALCTEPRAHALAKFEMIVSGKFISASGEQPIRTVLDLPDKVGVQVWKPCQKRLFAFWRAQRQLLTFGEWSAFYGRWGASVSTGWYVRNPALYDTIMNDTR